MLHTKLNTLKSPQIHTHPSIKHQTPTTTATAVVTTTFYLFRIMVQGLAFLSKKSWHTKNLANQEKVWIAEQRKAAEETKTKELARQIQQEREREEFDRLAGKKTHLDRGIDWMYQGQAAVGEDGDQKPSALEVEDAEKKAEEFLLGKEYQAPGGRAQGDFTEGANEGVNAVIHLEQRGAAAAAAEAAKKPSAYGPAAGAESSVADRNEAFRQRVEDPMFQVSQKERAKKSEAQKQQALYERVVGPVKDNDDDGGGGDDDDSNHSSRVGKKKSQKRDKKERRRRHRKESKKKRKRHHRHRTDDDNSLDGGDDRYERKRHRHRRDDSSNDGSEGSRRNRDSRDHHRRRKEVSRYDSEDSDGEAHRKKRSRSRDRGHGKSSKMLHDDSRRSHRDRSRSPEETRYSSSRRHKHEDHTSNHRDDNIKNNHNTDLNRLHNGPAKMEGFGLQGKAAASINTKDLGPKQDLVRQKRQTAEEERRRARERASSRRTMTAEERAQALKEMQATAEARTRETKRRSDDDDDNNEAPQSSKASFIKELNEQTHGLRASGGAHSLSARMAQNRNTQQRLQDDNFL